MTKKVLMIVFSRDRALQLDATLQSFFRHCSDPEKANINILYRASDDRFAKQYKKLETEYQSRGVRFLQEVTFGDDLLRTIFQFSSVPFVLGRFFFSVLYSFRKLVTGSFKGLHPHGNILFVVDDTIFVRPFSLQKICYLLEENPDALGFSLRLGLNTINCYTLNRSQFVPRYEEIQGNVIRFIWFGADADFGYPLEVSSSMYRIADLLPLLSYLPIKNPNGLEGKMYLHVKDFADKKEFLLCFNQTVAFSNPVNRVQNLNTNRAGVDISHTSQDLAAMFEDGYRIRIDVLDNFIPTGCHQEVAFTFEKSISG
jgi:hypothetical protein